MQIKAEKESENGTSPSCYEIGNSEIIDIKNINVKVEIDNDDSDTDLSGYDFESETEEDQLEVKYF